MSISKSNPDSPPLHGGRFATTRWSMVVSAGQSRSTQSRRALAVLCENYWFPLYAFVRRSGRSAEDAQDLTQEFFVRLLTENYLAVADRQQGRFRSFLLGAMKHFLANQRRRQAAQKRGGAATVLSLDFDGGEHRYGQIEPSTNLTAERLYEKRWAMTLLDLVLGRLREEFRVAGKLELFDVLKQFLAGGGKHDGSPTYLDVGKQLGMSEAAVKTAVHRLRRRYRKLLKDEIAQTVDGHGSLEEELRDLMAALGSEK